jgi:hypothetical protein
VNTTLSIFSFSLLLSTGISLVLAISAMKQHAGSARISLSLLMLAVAQWSFTSFLIGVSHAQEIKIFWNTIGYLGVTATPVLFFIPGILHPAELAQAPRFMAHLDHSLADHLGCFYQSLDGSVMGISFV